MGSVPSPPETRQRPTGRPARRTGGRWWLWAAIGSAALAVVFGVLFALDLSSHTPAPLALPRVAGASSGLAAGPVSGTWTIGPGSQVGYRVHEVLFGLDHTAVGRTSKVSGGVTLSGSEVVAADFTVQMHAVKTNQAGRQVMWDDFIMKTGAYPQARFRLTEPIHLGGVPAVGKVVPTHATGALTMRGVTRVVTFAIQGERVSPTAIDLHAAIPITFADWKIPRPNLAITKVSKSGTLEVLLHLHPAERA